MVRDPKAAPRKLRTLADELEREAAAVPPPVLAADVIEAVVPRDCEIHFRNFVKPELLGSSHYNALDDLRNQAADSMSRHLAAKMEFRQVTEPPWFSHSAQAYVPRLGLEYRASAVVLTRAQLVETVRAAIEAGRTGIIPSKVFT